MLLQRFSMEMLGSDEGDAFYDKIVDTARSLMRSDVATIQLFHPDRGRHGELEMLAHVGLSAEAAVFWATVDHTRGSSCAEALRTNGRVVVPDTATADWLQPALDLEFFRSNGIRTLQSTPLVTRTGILVGMLSTHWCALHPLSEQDMRALDILARQAADAIEGRVARARLQEDLRNMQVLRDLAQLPMGVQDLGSLYEEILTAAITIMDSDAGTVQILDEATQELVIMATRGFSPPVQAYFHRLNARSGTSCGIALATNQRTFLDFDVPASADPDGTLRMHLDDGYHCAQSTPLVARGGKAVGMVSTHWRTRRTPTDRQLYYLDLLARQAADVIEHWTTSAALQRSEEKFRTLFESIDEGYCIIRVVFDVAGRAYDYVFEDVNPSFERQTGIRDAVGRSMRAIVPKHEEHWYETYGRIVRTGIPERFENQAEALGRWYDVYAFRIGTAEEHRVAVLFHDLTERKVAENALREADRRKDEFLATLSHELRNPLAPLRNGMELLRDTLDDPAERTLVLDLVDRQFGQMVRLIDDLMDTSRINQGKLQLQRKRVSLRRVLDDAAEAVRPALEARSHAFRLEAPSSAVVIDVDHARLVQVVGNLLTNAVKYTEPGGRVHLDARVEGLDVVLAVSDTGIGIPPEAQSGLFEMFSQVHGPIDRTQGGLGIGLNLVKRLVELHEGTVTVHSEGLGHGARFTVRLPVVVKSPPAENQPTSAPRRQVADHRVLVVDDNMDGAVTLAMLLAGAGCTTRTAFDGEMALQLAADFVPRVVLLDIGLPKLNGYEVARRLRNMPALKDVVLVAITGWGQNEDKQLALEAGFDHHFVKPVVPRNVIELIAGLPVDHATHTADRPVQRM